MSYRLVKFSGLYPGFLAEYRLRHPEMCRRPYAEAHAHLADQAFGWSDFYCRRLRERGVDAHEIFVNVPWLQEAWAREHGMPELSGAALALQQARRLDPDIVFLQFTPSFSEQWLNEARTALRGGVKLVSWRCAPYVAGEAGYFARYDLVLTCNPFFQRFMEARGVKLRFMHHGFESALQARLRSEAGKHGVLFAGSLVQGKDFHGERIRLLAEFMRSDLPLTLMGESAPFAKNVVKALGGLAARSAEVAGLGTALKNISAYNRALAWRAIPLVDRDMALLKHALRPPVYGIDLYNALGSANVCLNSHIDSSGDFAGNSRLFEATGSGSCLLTDAKSNLSGLFEIDREVVAFSSAEECIEKARWLLDHPRERQEIAEAGRRRTLRDHTLAQRAADMDGMFRELLAN